MNKYLIALVFLLIFAGAGGFFLYQKSLNTEIAIESENTTDSKQKSTEETPIETAGSEDAVLDKKYSLSQISEHNKDSDCWFAIEGKVYDATDYIKDTKHPGGKAILQGCGNDATELFNTRPMGSNTPHSQKARDYLKNFEIGTLEQ